MSYADKVFVENVKDILETACGIPTRKSARIGKTARPRTPSRNFAS